MVRSYEVAPLCPRVISSNRALRQARTVRANGVRNVESVLTSASSSRSCQYRQLLPELAAKPLPARDPLGRGIFRGIGCSDWNLNPPNWDWAKRARRAVFFLLGAVADPYTDRPPAS